jgi:hypothetical protein
VPGVQRLAHGVRAERLLQPGRHRGGGGERVRELGHVELEDLGGGRGRADGADGAGGVPVGVVGRLDGGGDPVADLVPDGDGTEHLLPRRVHVLAERQCGGHCRRPRVVDALTEDVVELGGVRGGAVDERGGARVRGRAGRDEARLPRAGGVHERLAHDAGRLHRCARDRRAEPVDDGARGRGVHLVRQPLRAGGDREAGQLFGDHARLLAG